MHRDYILCLLVDLCSCMCFLCAANDNDGKQSLSLCLGKIGNALMSTWDGSCPGIFFLFY